MQLNGREFSCVAAISGAGRGGGFGRLAGGAMVSRIIKVNPFDIVVFGGTGDLACRKLYPALFHRLLDGQLEAPTRVLGLSRTPSAKAISAKQSAPR